MASLTWQVLSSSSLLSQPEAGVAHSCVTQEESDRPAELELINERTVTETAMPRLRQVCIHLSSHLWCTSAAALQMCQVLNWEMWWCWRARCLSHTSQQVSSGPTCLPDLCSVSMSEWCCPSAERIPPPLCQTIAWGGGSWGDSAPSPGCLSAEQQVLRWQMFSATSSALQTAKAWLDIHSCAETPTGREELMAWKPFLYLM